MDQGKIIENYCVTNKLLGSGSFAKVFLGYKKDNKKDIVAVKVIPI